MKKNFFILFIATSAFAAPVPLDIDLFSTANFTGAQSAAGTAINITNGSTVNFQDQSDPDSAPISVSNDSFLNFSETTPTIYSGQLTGSGTVTKNGTGNLTMSGNNSGFTGPLFVQSGTLFLDGAYGGSVTSSASAHIVYKGPISGNLDITSGTITTAGINTLQVGGNYTQAPNTIYIANLSSSGQSSLINIAGTASIAGSVQIDASLGVLTNHTYEILHANGGVSGTYGLINPYPALKVSITYDANNVYLSFGSSLLGLAATPNEKNVAAQLDKLIPTTTSENELLSSLLLLTPAETRKALNILSGEQYSNPILANMYDGSRFSKKIFNSLRTNINRCIRSCPGTYNWLSVGGGQGFQKGGHAHPGFNLGTYDINTGMHSCVNKSWIFGGALGYNSDFVDSDLHTETTMKTGTAAIYSCFQKELLYFVTDLIAARTWSRVNRRIHFGTIHQRAHSSPHLAYGRFDLQLGGNLGNCYYNIKPYIAGSVEVYHQESVHEQGARAINLSIQALTKWLGTSQLGFHTSFAPYRKTSIDFDIAWQHYFGNLRVYEDVRFEDFGTSFPILGPKRSQDGCLANLYITTPVGKSWSMYLGAEGEIWGDWYAYEADAGVSYKW